MVVGPAACGKRAARISRSSRRGLERRRGKEFGGVRLREVGRKLVHGAEAERSRGDSFQDRRKLERGPCGVDPLFRGVLRQVQPAHTVVVQRLVAGWHVELALVDLGQVGEEVGQRAALLRQVRLESVEDFAVQEMLQREAIHRPSPSKPVRSALKVRGRFLCTTRKFDAHRSTENAERHSRQQLSWPSHAECVCAQFWRTDANQWSDISSLRIRNFLAVKEENRPSRPRAPRARGAALSKCVSPGASPPAPTRP
jgi:hypothetical protein